MGEAAPVAVKLSGLEVTVYPVIADPPVVTGGVNVIMAWPLPAVAVPITGAVGATAFTLKLCVTVGAGVKAALPAWSALTLQVPIVRKANVPPVVMLQTLGVVDVNATTRLDEAVAGKAGVVPKF